jgi:hypothetical protein
LQHIKIPQAVNARVRRRRRRVGADVAFAKAMARAEFGRFYTDEREQQEVRRSLQRAKARRRQEPGGGEQTLAEEMTAKPDGKGGAKPKLWHRPSVRERRTEISEGMARLIAGAKRRKAEGPGEKS